MRLEDQDVTVDAEDGKVIEDESKSGSECEADDEHLRQRCKVSNRHKILFLEKLHMLLLNNRKQKSGNLWLRYRHCKHS